MHNRDRVHQCFSSFSGVYLEHFKALSPSCPRLLYLAHFMEASTVPAKAKLFIERWKRVKASGLSFSNLQDIERKDCNSLEGLSTLLKPLENSIKVNRLLASEDLYFRTH